MAAVIVASAMLATLVLACARPRPRPPPASADSLLRHVPADTPYLYVSLRPLGKTLRQGGFATAVDRVERLIAAVGARAGRAGDAAGASPPQRFVVELARALGGGGAGGGISDDTRFVIFGVGLAPVLRVTGADAARLERVIVDAAARAGVNLSRRRWQGHAYYAVPLPGGAAIAALDGDDLVAAVVPGDVEAWLPGLLGGELPAASFAAEADRLAAQHGVDRDTLMVVDLARLVGLVADGDPMLGFAGDAAPSRRCPRALKALAADLPRLVIGEESYDDAAIVTRYAVELKPGAAAVLHEAVRAAPRWLEAPRPGAQLEAAIALDVGVVVGAVERWLARLGGAAPGCAAGDLTTTFRTAAARLHEVADSSLTEIDGVTASYRTTAGTPGVAVAAVIRAPRPRALLQLLWRQLPMLEGIQELELAEGTVVPAPLPVLELLGGAWILVGDGVLGLAVGAGAGDDLTALAAAPPGPAVAALMRGDGAFLAARGRGDGDSGAADGDTDVAAAPVDAGAEPAPAAPAPPPRPGAGGVQLGLFELRVELLGDDVVVRSVQHFIR